jgi:hypothetical protein
MCSDFHIPNSSSSLVITIKLKAKYECNMAAMLFHILKEKKYFEKSSVYFKIYYHTFQDLSLTGVSVTSISGHVAAMLVLLMIGN